MKHGGQVLLGLAFAALLTLSGRALVTKPEEPAETSPLPPRPAALCAASEAAPAEDALNQRTVDTSARWSLPEWAGERVQAAGDLTRDGNGFPLGSRPYVRTVYTACRAEDTSG